MIIYIGIFAMGFLAISLWSAWLVTHPKTIESGLTPDRYNLRFEEVSLTTKDKIKISGWFIPRLSQEKSEEPNGPALIILHGYPAEKGDMLSLANSLHSGFNILLIDFRSFGKSGGRHTTLGAKERLDVSSALDFLESRGYSAKGGSAPGGKKIGILGFSLGGAVAITTAAEDPRIAAVVSYASFADLTLLGYETYRHLPVINRPLVQLMKIWAKTFWGVNTSLSPDFAARKLSTPVLIIHTKPDEQIPFRHAELLKDALKNNPNAEFYFPEEGLHGELPGDFNKRVKDFLVKYL